MLINKYGEEKQKSLLVRDGNIVNKVDPEREHGTRDECNVGICH